MDMSLIGRSARMLAALACAMLAYPASSQPYPTKQPIRVIVDGPAGGINDIWARRYTQRIGESMQQTILVENRPGASGTIAAEALVKAAPDGYTMFFGGMTPLVAYPGAGGAVRYDPVRDFVPVAVSTMGYPLFVVNSALGIKMRTVPYKGGSAALMDAAAGQIQVAVGYTAEL